jgi:hypothetical protein
MNENPLLGFRRGTCFKFECDGMKQYKVTATSSTATREAGSCWILKIHEFDIIVEGKADGDDDDDDDGDASVRVITGE